MVHFEYTSGANPYIVFDSRTAYKVIKRWNSVGVNVTKITDNMYRVDDKEYEKIHSCSGAGKFI